MKKVLSFDVDQTLNIAKTPIVDEIAKLLIGCLDAGFEVCPISGQKFDQFLIQIVDRLVANGATSKNLSHLHLFVAQGTQYYRYQYDDLQQQESSPSYNVKHWTQVYDYPLTKDDTDKIIKTLETAAKELGYWEEQLLQPGDEIIENRLSQVTFSALGQKAGTEVKYAWDPDCSKRQKIVSRAKELAPEFAYEIGGTTSINATLPGRNKHFGMEHLMDELNVTEKDILYFGDMTQPGGNDYPIVEMGIDTITVRNYEDTAYALRGILGVL